MKTVMKACLRQATTIDDMHHLSCSWPSRSRSAMRLAAPIDERVVVRDCSRDDDLAACSRLVNVLNVDRRGRCIVQCSKHVLIVSPDEEAVVAVVAGDVIVDVACAGRWIIIVTATALTIVENSVVMPYSLPIRYDAKGVAGVVIAATTMVAIATSNGVQIVMVLDEGDTDEIELIHRAFPMTMVSFSHNGRYLACAALDGHIGLWATASMSFLWSGVAPGSTDRVTSLQFAPFDNGGYVLAVATWSGQIQRLQCDNDDDDWSSWSIVSSGPAQACASTCSLAGIGAFLIAYSPNGAFMATSSAVRPDEIVIWGIEANRPWHSLSIGAPVRGLASSSTYLFAYSRARQLHCWPWPRICIERTIDPLLDLVISSDFVVHVCAPDVAIRTSPALLTAIDSPLQLRVRLQHWPEPRSIAAPFLSTSTAFDPTVFFNIVGARSFAVIRDELVYIWTERGGGQWAAVAHAAHVESAAFSGDNDTLITLFDRTTSAVRLCIWTPRGPASALYHCSLKQTFKAPVDLHGRQLRLVGQRTSTDFVVEAYGPPTLPCLRLWMCSISNANACTSRLFTLPKGAYRRRGRVCAVFGPIVGISGAASDEVWWVAPALSLAAKTATAAVVPPEFAANCTARLAALRISGNAG